MLKEIKSWVEYYFPWMILVGSILLIVIGITLTGNSL